MSEIYKDVAVRFIKASNENHVLFNEELEILTHLVTKFKLLSISEYAHKEEEQEHLKKLYHWL
jgi:RNA recognition motif-containing protein